jgi:hypothetical protein
LQIGSGYDVFPGRRHIMTISPARAANGHTLS